MNFTGCKGTIFFRNTQEIQVDGIIFFEKCVKHLYSQKNICTFAIVIFKYVSNKKKLYSQFKISAL
jgi:hypothetical protein